MLIEYLLVIIKTFTNKHIFKRLIYFCRLVILFNTNTIYSKYTLNSLSTPTGGADRVSGGAVAPPSTPLAPPLVRSGVGEFDTSISSFISALTICRVIIMHY